MTKCLKYVNISQTCTATTRLSHALGAHGAKRQRKCTSVWPHFFGAPCRFNEELPIATKIKVGKVTGITDRPTFGES